jgi:hypothetical protein
MDTMEDLISGYQAGELIFLSEAIETLDNEVEAYFGMINVTINQIFAKKMASSEDRSRLSFLRDTISMLNEHFKNQHISVKILGQYEEYKKLIFMRLHDVYNIVNRYLHGEIAITSNFDIFELKMRGYLQELRALFPLDSTVEILPMPSSLILEQEPRDMWIKHFGGEKYFISFEEYVKMLEDEEMCQFGEERYETFKMFLKYFLNFPSDELISPYKWNSLLRLFGPFDRFCENFMNIVTKRGFLGLINRVEAYEILTMRHINRSLLIRLSRTEPGFFAFSYRNSDGHIGHLINRGDNGEVVNVDDFIASKFPNYQLINSSLNIEAIIFRNINVGPLEGGRQYETIGLCEYSKGSYTRYTKEK